MHRRDMQIPILVHEGNLPLSRHISLVEVDLLYLKGVFDCEIEGLTISHIVEAYYFTIGAIHYCQDIIGD